MTTPDGPAVLEGAVDDSTLDALLQDWSGACELLEVRRRDDGAAPSLPATADGVIRGVELLRGRHIAGLQIRYRFGGLTWCDTLMPAPAGALKLVRVSLPLS